MIFPPSFFEKEETLLCQASLRILYEYSCLIFLERRKASSLLIKYIEKLHESQ